MFKIDPVCQPTVETINGFEGVVRKINWVYESLGSDFNHYVHGPALELIPPSPGDSFIPFASLTEDQVNVWIDSVLTPEEKQFYISKDAEVRAQVAKEKEKVDEEGRPPEVYKDVFDGADRHSWAVYAAAEQKTYPWLLNN